MNDINAVTVIFQLIGGLGLFLLGMQLMSEGLQKSSGDSLKKILEKLTTNRLIGTGVGAVVTAIIQSSSATTVMVVGFVNAGLMNLTQALSVILGANIGTTITGQIISFKISGIALPCIGLGAVLYIFFRKPALQYLGQIVMGFGLLFLGMDTMTDAFKPLAKSEEFKSIFVYFSHNPVAAVIAGALTTLVVQSSSATIGITIALATAGIIDFPAAAALVLGENIGTTITANLAALNASRPAKQAAFGHFLFNLIGVTYMLIFLTPFMHFVNFITPGDVAESVKQGAETIYPNIGRHIANLHTMFNVINTIIFLPFLPLLAKLCEKIIKDNKEEKIETNVVHLSDGMLSTPEIAVGLTQKEAGRMFLTSVNLFDYAKKALLENDKHSFSEGKTLSNTIDVFNDEIHLFLTKLSAKSLSAKSLHTIHSISAAVEEINQIGDRSLKLIKTKNKMNEKNIVFSQDATNELNNIIQLVDEFTTNVKNLYFAVDKENAMKDFAENEDKIDKLRKLYKKNHLKRLDEGKCSLPAGLAFVDLLNTLEKIADNIYAIAQIITDENF